jgi:HlyD family secretion protein
VEALKVRAGVQGILQDLPVQIGQRVVAGTVLAKVARPDRLKAEIEIAETQASDVRPGQHAVVDTHNALVPGHVVRVSPAVHDGTVSVEVDLDGPPPRGARPDQNVEGTIELAHLEDVLTVGRPAVGGEGSTVSLFRLVDGGKNAIRTTVKVGRTSVDAVQVLDGLKPGDKVILSDMSQYDAVNRVKIE